MLMSVLGGLDTGTCATDVIPIAKDVGLRFANFFGSAPVQTVLMVMQPSYVTEYVCACMENAQMTSYRN